MSGTEQQSELEILDKFLLNLLSVSVRVWRGKKIVNAHVSKLNWLFPSSLTNVWIGAV